MVYKEEVLNMDGLKIISPSKFTDIRGYYIETYNEELYDNLNCPKFVQDDISVSKKDVLRGIHGDSNTWKLISCMYGNFKLVVVCNNPESNDYLHTWEFDMSGDDYKQILVPPKYGNGHLVLSDVAIFHYKQSTYYQGMENQFTIKWNDPRFNFNWPISNPILSERDK